MKKIFFLISLSFCIILCACNKNENKKTVSNTYTVTKENLHKSLFFTGIFQPINESTLSNPVDGIVENMHFNYGQKVKKDDIVFTLNSEALQREFNVSLTEYLKAKDNWANANSKFQGIQSLWDEGLIAKNNYLSEQSSLKHTHVALIESKNKLASIIEKFGENNTQDIENLSFKDFEQVRKTLDNKHNLLKLKASIDGILLYPPKQTDERNKLTIGCAVKAGTSMALIGDLSGVKIEIDIPEVDIDKIKVGMSAIIKSTAFPEDTLLGQIISINSQASISSSPLPSFSAIVEVRKLTSSQKSWVKVGMSAEIEIPLNMNEKILVPRQAISKINDENFVQVKTAAGKIENRKIKIQNLEQDKFVVSSGIKAGEKVVLG